MKKKYLLASDMDGTVIPLETGSERESEINEFSKLVQQNPQILLAYVTGRHLELALDGIREFTLPTPDVLVCDVGTSVYNREQGDWVADKVFRNNLLRSWKGLTGGDIDEILSGISGLTAQEPERQKEFKQSYYLPLKEDNRVTLARIRRRLEESGLGANIIYSEDSVKKIGLVDVLPESAAKNTALEYLSVKYEMDHDAVVYAGDSGNDLEAFVSGFNAIIVQNTAQSVKEEVRRKARESKIEHRICFAIEKYAKGVIEGCYHFRLFR